MKSEGKIRVIADIREKHTGAVKELFELGVAVDLKQLPIGDFICSSRVVVEVKRAGDFVNSIIDGRLLQQLREMKEHFERPLLIIEGATEDDFFHFRNVHPNAIRGMLATIAIGYGIPMMNTKNPRDTAGMLIAIARRELKEHVPEPAMHSTKPPSLQERQEYVISSLPGIELKLARALLGKFGSVSDVLNATDEQLQKVELIGPKKAATIKKVVNSDYRPAQA